jgi:hypothetical protein
MRRFTVELDETDFHALTRLAIEKRRDVRDQAAVLLEARLRLARRRLEDELRSGTPGRPLSELVVGPA